MNLCNLLPTAGLPRTGYPASQEVKWLGGDNLENYRLRGGHPLYGENDIIYSLNSLGYRCPEFDMVASIRIVAIGCSYVLGAALPQRAIFHELFAEKLRAIVSPRAVVVWNLGVGGASNDYISRVLYFAVQRLNPHIVLINFTRFSRREYISGQNRYLNYNSNFSPTDEIAKDIFRHFAALSSPFDDQLNFFKNYKAVECLLTGCHWFYSHIKEPEPGPVASLVDLQRCVGSFQMLDRARDNGHAGPQSHRRVAELYWAKFIELGGLAHCAYTPTKSNLNIQ
jgi:hypothetical protein